MYAVQQITALDTAITEISHDIIAIWVFIIILSIASLVCFTYGVVKKNKDKTFAGFILIALVIGFAFGQGYQVYDREMLKNEKQEIIDKIKIQELPPVQNEDMIELRRILHFE